MAVTTQMRTQVTQLYVSLFGRAPEASGLGYWVSQLSAGKSFQTVAQDMFNVDASRVTYPTYLTNEEIVAKFYVNVLGRTADAGGLAYWTGRLNTESTTGTAASKMIAVGTVITEMLTAVVAYSGTDAAGLQSQSLFNNKVAVGLHYAVDLGGDNIPFASTLMPMVSSGPTGANAALAAIDSTLASSLTNGIDNLTANVFTSVPVYTPGGNDFINSLQDEDSLTGVGVNPTLNATLGSVNDAAESVIVPKMSGVQTANFEITGNAGGVNFQDSTGLTNLNINRITQTNATVTMTDLDKSTTALSVSNATRDGTVNFLYKEDNLLGTSDEVTLNLSNTRLKSLKIDETGDSGEDQGYGFETVNVNVNQVSNIDTMIIGANTREDASTANASQTVNIVAKANTEINNLTANGAETINLTANADVMIAADERNTLQASNNGINTLDLTKLTITGAGNVTIDGLEGNINEKSTVNGEKGVTLVVDGSTMTGALKLGVAVAADGNSSGDWATHTDKDVSITSGSGNDIIETYTALAGDITTGAGNDQVLVNNGASPAVYTNVEGVSTINTGTGNDTVRAKDLLATAADAADGNTSFGQVTAASVVTGEGDDTVAVEALASAVDTDNGSLKDSNVDDTYFKKGASVDTGAGNDSITFTTVAEGASISAGEGNDSITVELVGATVLAADDTSKAEVNLDKSANALGAIVDLGAGDDTADFYQEDTSDGAVATTIVGLDAELRAGAGSDVLNVSALDAVTVNVNTTWTAKADDTNANITGVETANFTVLDQINAATETATDFAANDDTETDGSITADVMRFDSALTAINLVSEEQALLQTAVTEIYRAGTATTFTLNNMREEVALTLKANEATGVDGDGALKDDEAVDVNLNVNMASARGAAETFTLNIAEGSGAFDLNLNLGATLTDKVGNDASKTDDDDMRVENVVVKLAADDKGHYINFNGFGDAPHTDAPEEGSKTVVTSLTVNGGVAGTKLVLDNVSADTITAAGAADVKLKLNGSNNFTVTTGSGNDVINMMSDDVRANDITDDAADDNSVDATDEADAVNAGAGNDRIIINGGDNLGIYTGVAQRTDDDVFNKIKSVESIEIQGGGTNVVILDEAAATTGANLQNIYVTGTGAQTTTIQIGENFINDNGSVKNTLNIDSTKDLSKDYGAAAKDGALTLNIENQDTDQDIDLVNLNVIVGMEKGTDLNFQNTGDASATVAITATVAKNVVNTVGSSLAASAGNLSIDITTGSIDKVVLLDSANDTKAVVPDNADNGAITINVNDNWSKTAIEFDASGIKNNDAGAGVDGGAAVEELEGTTGQAQVAGIQGRDTGGLTFNGATELDAKLTVKGTQNDDNITGGNQADTLHGNDGDDIINGGLGNDTIDGGNGNDSLIGGIGADTISAGAGDDTINGGVGADVLSGGAGKDTYIYASVVESNGDGADSISDFVTAEDKIQLNGVVNGTAAGDFINLSSFATVATAGDGDNSLLGTTGAPVMGDAYYATDSKQLVIDVDGNGDITTAADLVIQSTGPIAASDINFTIDTGAGNDFIRGGQGVDSLTAAGGDDTFVVVGSLSSSDVAGYSAAYASGAGNNSTAVLGGALVAQEAKLLRATELLSARSTTEVSKGDVYDGGADNDTMHVFGTASFVGATISNIENLVIHSSATFTIDQIMSFGSIVFDGNVPHAITITKNDGTALTQAEQLAVLAAVPSVSSTGGTITVGGTTYADQAALLTAVNTTGAAGQPAGSTQADLASGDDSGASNADNITNQTTGLTFSGSVVGTVAAANIVVFDDVDGDGVKDAGEAAFSGLTASTVGGTTTWTVDAALANGVHNVRAYTTNANGLRSDLSTNLVVNVDTVAPATPVVALTTDSGSSNSDKITNVGTLALTTDAGTTTTYSVDGGTTFTNSFTAVSGNNSVIVRSTDVAGNMSTSAAFAFTLDTTAPTTPVVALTTDTGSSNSDMVSSIGTLNLTTEAGSTTSYSIDGGTTFGATFTAAQGANSVIVRSTDVAGNTAQSAAFAFTLDTVAPTVPVAALTADTGSSNSDKISSTGTLALTTDAGSTTAYSIDGGTTFGATFTAAEGANSVIVRSTDAAGNTAQSAAFTFTLDTTAPTVPVVALTTDSGVSNSDMVSSVGTLNLTTDAGSTTSYSIDGGTTFGATFTAAQGANNVIVRSTDVAGNTAQSAAFVFTLDTIAPTSPTVDLLTDTGSSGTDDYSSVGTLDVQGITGTDYAEYSANGGVTWSTTFTPVEGSNVVFVRTKDLAGNASGAVAYAFTLDTTVPSTATVALTADTGSSGADAITSNSNLNVTTTEAGATVEYSLDAGATWGAYVPGIDGAKSVLVRSTDQAGNTSVSAPLAFTLDTTVPTTATVALVADTGTVEGITSNSALNVTTTEAGATVDYSLDAGATWGAYVPGIDGAKSVLVRSTDVAGNTSVSAAFTFTLDTTAPTVATVALTSDSGTGGDNITSNGALNVTTTEAGATVEYSLDAGATWGAYAAGADGAKSVLVRSTDAAGITSVSSAFAFTLDTTTTAATVALTTDTGSNGADQITSVSALTITGTEAGSTLTYSFDAGATFGAYSPVQGANSVIVRSTDAAGNTADSAAFAFTLDTVAPVATNNLITYNNAGTVTDFTDDFWEVTFTDANALSIADSTLIQLYNATEGNYGSFTASIVASTTLRLTSTGAQPGSWTAGDVIDIAIGAGALVDAAGNQVTVIGIAGNYTGVALV